MNYINIQRWALLMVSKTEPSLFFLLDIFRQTGKGLEKWWCDCSFDEW